MSSVKQPWIEVNPTLRAQARDIARFRNLLKELTQIGRDEPDFAMVVQDFRRRALDALPKSHSPEVAELRVAFSVLTDLFTQGWAIKVRGSTIQCLRPAEGADLAAEKDRVRNGLFIARDEQLREQSVRDFITSMEQPRQHEGRWVSISSLVRDGVCLADDLEALADETDPVTRSEILKRIIDPYIEFVEEGKVCPFTGIRLHDVWRYFRHTWLTPLRSTPGRTMPILIRDAAAENHPVIGIAALSSSIVQQSERDRWIGWRGEDVLASLDQDCTTESAEWLLRSLDELTDAIYMGDFFRDELVSSKDLKAPSWSVIESLRSFAESRKEQHKMQPPGTRSKAGIAGNFLEEAQTDLFTFKRASTLADLLEIRLAFNQAGLVYPEKRSLATALELDAFRLAVAKLVRRIKANNVGINMMDISVAGAIEPYRAILGGKLVSMLLCSPEVISEYERRYSQQPSVIASALKGRSVFKRPSLVLLCTTSLFGAGSSQYNRISIPVGEDRIRFLKLEQRTEFGTFHFSQATLAEMKWLSEVDFQGTITNGIFGEGVNPKMRKIRESLDRVGLPANEFLRHSTPRAVYVIPLCRNFRQVLLGIEAEPQYYMPCADGLRGTEAIASAWITRWLEPRINSYEALMQVRAHSRDFFFTHGARVQLPEVEEEQGSLFEDVDDDWADESF